MKTYYLILSLSLLLSSMACGTFSSLRPADTLSEKEVEFTGAVAANHIGIVVPALRIDYGVSDRVEIGAQYEVYSYLVNARYGLLKSEEDGIGLALGLAAGEAFFISNFSSSFSDAVWRSSPVFAPTLTIGRKWDSFELYLGYKAFFGTSGNYEIGSLKLGTRFWVSKGLGLTLEGGTTHHRLTNQSYLSLLEAAAGFAFRF
jgi:hypothetical protein